MIPEKILNEFPLTLYKISARAAEKDVGIQIQVLPFQVKRTAKSFVNFDGSRIKIDSLLKPDTNVIEYHYIWHTYCEEADIAKAISMLETKIRELTFEGFSRMEAIKNNAMAESVIKYRTNKDDYN